ncbi:unnamed protein product [Spirodela intermedia]|uniref:Uncharacterized protein n=1 Tax=Spirodela intermedia TaxID=51605 RepID=A0A7I8KIL9_SPIIN|nr:unnamed protein product [Spirodela intermedia]
MASTRPPAPPLPSSSSSSSSPAAAPAHLLLRRVADSRSLREVHAQILKCPTPPPPPVHNQLVALYSLFGHMDSAERAFRRIPLSDSSSDSSFSWNAMIRGFACHGFPEEALRFYSQMLLLSPSSPAPDKFTFPFVLRACATVAAAEEALQAHGQILRLGLSSDVYISTALVHLYMKLGEMCKARRIFDGIAAKSTVSWNALMAGYAGNGADMEALRCFEAMVESGAELDSSTLVSIVPSISRIGDLERGRSVHRLAVEMEIELTEPAKNCLIDMYGKCGDLDASLSIFTDLPDQKKKKKSVVSWNVAISACAINANAATKALELFRAMLRLSAGAAAPPPNAVTIATVLPLCADLADFHLGAAIHGLCVKKGLDDADAVVGTALLDMYAKCGCAEDARRIFDEMPHRTVVSWNAMISGYGLQGQGREALETFQRMLLAGGGGGAAPNHSTFISLISACGHAGMVEEGLKVFTSMSRDFDLLPETRHYAAVVDLLARAGRVEEAYEFIMGMPVEPDDAVWGALLGACKIHRRVELGEAAAKKAMELKPDEAGYRVLLANLYAAAGRWEEAQNLRKTMKKKEAGRSSIQGAGLVHSFLAG